MGELALVGRDSVEPPGDVPDFGSTESRPTGCGEDGAANNSAFQRYVHEFPHAPWGPPWIKNFSGYFFAGSNLGGLTMNPCTSSSFAPLNVNDSTGCMSICDSRASFMWVTGTGTSCFVMNPPSSCARFESAPSAKTRRQISVGAAIDIRVK